jgi:hypothetical protein
MSNPMLLACEVAEILKADPVMARQLREHFTTLDDLTDLLEIPRVEAEPADDNNGPKDRQESLDDACAYIFDNMALEDILAAHRTYKK